MKNEQENQSNQGGNINYKIRSMESDLNNLDYKEGVYKKGEKEEEEDNKLQRQEGAKEKPKEKELKKEESEDFTEEENPFLEDIQKEEKSIFSDSNEKDKQQKHSPSPKKTTPSKPPQNKTLQKGTVNKKFNYTLLIFIMAASVAVAGSGAYYYFFLLDSQEKQERQPKEVNRNEEVNEEVNEEEEEEEVTQEKDLFSQELSEPDFVIEKENEDNLIQQIEKRLAVSENNNGKLYTFKKDDDFMNGEEVTEGLNITINNSITNNLEKSWIMTNENDFSLIFKINEDARNSLKPQVKEIESSLPEEMESLYSIFGKNLSTTKEEISFKTSTINENMRYFNFDEDSAETSLDWGIVEKHYLVFSTSKDMTEYITEIVESKNNANVDNNQGNNPRKEENQINESPSEPSNE
ncbi:MAG: hypothetical protein R6V40_00800 [Candidatus Moraniibacteriota bacterium]